MASVQNYAEYKENSILLIKWVSQIQVAVYYVWQYLKNHCCIYFFCLKSRQLWHQLEGIIQQTTDLCIQFDPHYVLLGYVYKNPNSLATNTVIIVTKSYIYSNSQTGPPVHLEGLLLHFKKVYDEQKLLAILELWSSKFKVILAINEASLLKPSVILSIVPFCVFSSSCCLFIICQLLVFTAWKKFRKVVFLAVSVLFLKFEGDTTDLNQTLT